MKKIIYSKGNYSLLAEHDKEYINLMILDDTTGSPLSQPLALSHKHQVTSYVAKYKMEIDRRSKQIDEIASIFNSLEGILVE